MYQFGKWRCTCRIANLRVNVLAREQSTSSPPGLINSRLVNAARVRPCWELDCNELRVVQSHSGTECHTYVDVPLHTHHGCPKAMLRVDDHPGYNVLLTIAHERNNCQPYKVVSYPWTPPSMEFCTMSPATTPRPPNAASRRLSTLSCTAHPAAGPPPSGKWNGLMACEAGMATSGLRVLAATRQ